ncbi:MAG: cysteine desulfurase [Candidatus Nanoarchaeia archaeon]|nr:cysteine desulfurase [Candidatus Nanoarchaeia archaeon]
MNFDKIRQDFPILNKVTYLDSACMSLKPIQVIDKINEYYKEYPGCGGRGMHSISKKVDEEVLNARKEIQKLLNIKKEDQIVFSKNTTESLNLVYNGLKINGGIITTDKEHNSNLVPVIRLCKKNGLKHTTIGSKDGIFDLEEFKEKMNRDVKLVSMVHTSNLDGSTIPAKEIIKIAHENGALTMLDGAQSAPHKEIDLKKLDVDLFACSGHKMLGPTGIGMLYGKEEILDKMEQFILGGETVTNSTYNSYEIEKVPNRFEAGLQHYSGIIGFGEACRYLRKVGMDNIVKQELKVNQIIDDGLRNIEGVSILGPEDVGLRPGITSFNYKNKDVHQIALLLDHSKKIMMRSGQHCVHSWFNKHNIKGSVRASLYLYNNEEDANKLVDGFKQVTKILG